MSDPIQNLKKLEQQFATIKPLVGRGNQLIATTQKAAGFAKTIFPWYSIQWDILNDPQQSRQRIDLGLFPETDLQFLAAQLFEAMNFLVRIRRLSNEAKQTQQSLKIYLFELLSRIHKPAMQPFPEEELPGFLASDKLSLKLISGAPAQPGKKLLRQWEETLQFNQKLHIPSFVRDFFYRWLKDLRSLSELGLSSHKTLDLESAQWALAWKKAGLSHREFEAAAYQTLIRMARVESQFTETIRRESIPQLEKAMKIAATKLAEYPLQEGGMAMPEPHLPDDIEPFDLQAYKEKLAKSKRPKT